MNVKLQCLCLITITISSLTQAQDENFNTNGRFNYKDELKLSDTVEVGPGQLSKDGKYFMLGLYKDTGDSAYYDIYKIDLTATAAQPLALNIPQITNRHEIFQCSATDDMQTIVFTANNFTGWANNDIAIAENSSPVNISVRMLDEVNAKDTSDAYPWVSPDGLRIYFTKDQEIYFAKRAKRSEKFESPQPLNYEGDVQSEIISAWLTADEEKLFYITTGNLIYYSERKKISDPFSFPHLYTDEFKEFEFISGISFTPDMKDMYVFYSGETQKILHYKVK